MQMKLVDTRAGIFTAEMSNRVSLALKNALFLLECEQAQSLAETLSEELSYFLYVSSDLCWDGSLLCILWHWLQSRCWCWPGQRAGWRTHPPGEHRTQLVSRGSTWSEFNHRLPHCCLFYFAYSDSFISWLTCSRCRIFPLMRPAGTGNKNGNIRYGCCSFTTAWLSSVFGQIIF